MKIKTKIIIILLIVVIFWFFILLFSINNRQNKIEEEIDNDFSHHSLEEEKLLFVEEIYYSLPKPLNNYIPKNSKYKIEYDEYLRVFNIYVEAENNKEFEEGVLESLNFFRQFNLEPCKDPLIAGLIWDVTDWSKINIDEISISNICELN